VVGVTRFPTDVGLAHHAPVRTPNVVHNTYYTGSRNLATRGVTVRNNFYRSPVYTNRWWTTHTWPWRTNRWVAGRNWWVPSAWPTVAAWGGLPATPLYYDYGTSLVYQGDTVYYNGEPLSNAVEYAQEASRFAERGRELQPAATDEWQPLGVFGLVEQEGQNADQVFQLAINKGGVIRGNYHHVPTDTSLPIYGWVDPRTRRAAWTSCKKLRKKREACETGR